MKETKYTCDHCGKELNEMHDYIEVELLIYDGFDTDLCDECYTEFVTIAKNFCKKREDKKL